MRTRSNYLSNILRVALLLIGERLGYISAGFSEYVLNPGRTPTSPSERSQHLGSPPPPLIDRMATMGRKPITSGWQFNSDSLPTHNTR